MRAIRRGDLWLQEDGSWLPSKGTRVSLSDSTATLIALQVDGAVLVRLADPEVPSSSTLKGQLLEALGFEPNSKLDWAFALSEVSRLANLESAVLAKPEVATQLPQRPWVPGRRPSTQPEPSHEEPK